MIDIKVATRKENAFTEFLEFHGFEIEELEGGVLRITREDEIPVFITSNETRLFFEVDLGNLNHLRLDQDLLFQFLDLNTEILPVGIGIDTSDSDAPHLVLVESRETANLNDNELLSVFDALELAVDRVSPLIEKHLRHG